MTKLVLHGSRVHFGLTPAHLTLPGTHDQIADKGRRKVMLPRGSGESGSVPRLCRLRGPKLARRKMVQTIQTSSEL